MDLYIQIMFRLGQVIFHIKASVQIGNVKMSAELDKNIFFKDAHFFCRNCKICRWVGGSVEIQLWLDEIIPSDASRADKEVLMHIN